MAIQKNKKGAPNDTPTDEAEAQAVSVAPDSDSNSVTPVPARTASPEPANSSSQATTEETSKVRKVGPRIGWTSEKFTTLVNTMFEMESNGEVMTLDNILAHLRESEHFAQEVELGLLNGEDGRQRVGTKIRDSRAARKAAIEGGNQDVVQLPEIQSGAGRRGSGLDLLMGPSTGA